MISSGGALQQLIKYFAEYALGNGQCCEEYSKMLTEEYSKVLTEKDPTLPKAPKYKKNSEKISSGI